MNDSLIFNVSNDLNNGINYTVPFDIIAKDLAKGHINPSIKFPNPYNVSNYQSPDILTVTVSRRITFSHKQK
jgi:hypothetical protein